MNDFVKNMIIEHKELCEKIDKLNEIVYNEDNPIHKQTNKIDYANMAIQLRAMRTYATSLECRLNNKGIFISDDGEYLEKINIVNHKAYFACPIREHKENGNDFDLDNQAEK